jgi:hypothetical protein
MLKNEKRICTFELIVEMKYAKERTSIGTRQGGNMERPAGTAKVVSRFVKL